MLNISIQRLFLKELEMLHSTEDQELFSRVSKSLIGLPLRRDTVGSLMLIQDKHGKMPSMIFTLNGLPLNSLVRDKSQMSLNGSDLNNGEKVTHQDFSTMKSLNQLGSDTVVTSITLRKIFTHSLMLTKIQSSFSVLTPLQLKVENSSRKNGKL